MRHTCGTNVLPSGPVQFLASSCPDGREREPALKHRCRVHRVTGQVLWAQVLQALVLTAQHFPQDREQPQKMPQKFLDRWEAVHFGAESFLTSRHLPDFCDDASY